MISHGASRVGLMFARARGGAVRLCAVTAGALAVCAVAFAGTAAAFPAGCSQSGTTVTCTYTSGGETAFVVPAGVNSVDATVVGQQGGSDYGDGNAGALGAVASGTIGVTGGEMLYLEVGVLGGSGGRGNRSSQLLGGDGGGESDVRTCSATGTCTSGTTLGSRLLVAGGGGGRGEFGGAGGNAGTTGAGGNGGDGSFSTTAGGGGGATTTAPGSGGAGADGGSSGADGATAGGAGGAGGGSNALNGTPGGGGGAGWFGGGGGGGQMDTNQAGGGGGGGSSDADSSVSNPSFSQATAGETPSVTLTFSAPDLTTTPNPTTATLGTAAQTLTDSAVLSGGNNPTGTITFTLVGPAGATVDSETVTVAGNGAYSTPNGFSLTGAAAGTYQWDASYSGDSNNPAVDDDSDPAEQVVVSPANPTLASTPSPTAATLGPSAPTLTDSAVLSGGSAPSGTITFTLLAPSGTTVDTETVSVTGANGTYSTPTGFSLTGAAAGMYQWNATYSGDSNNNTASDDNDPAEQVTVSPASPTLTTTPSPASATVGNLATLTDSATLSGGSAPRGTITFTLFLNGGATPVDTETRSVSGNGTYTTPAGYVLPPAGSAGTYQWDATYSGDSNNTLVSDNNDPTEQVVVSPASPGLTGSPSTSAVTLGSGTTNLTDSAVLAGGVSPTGTITFTLSLNGIASPVDTETVPVSGNGTYTTPTGYNVPKTPAAVGTYQWNTSYSGDPNNSPASDANDPNEQVVVSAANPAVSVTSPANGAVYAVGKSVSSNFICSEGVGGPGISTCVNQNNETSGQPVDTSTVGVHTFTVTATSDDGQTGTQSTVSYTVAGGPSASISLAASGGVYAVGQVGPATMFACTDGAQGPGIGTCTDSNGSAPATASSTPRPRDRTPTR